MNRRDFLKFGGITVATLLIPGGILFEELNRQPVEISTGGTVYRGTPSGEIYASKDSGQTWLLHTRLGSEYSILGFSEDRSKGIHAQVGFIGRSFELVLSKDRKYWLTS